MKLQFLGAADTVTGSKYLVSQGRQTILVDCGLFQGFKVLRQRNWASLPVDPRSIDAVVLTHAHLDHSGYLPLLVKNGFSGPIYCTEGTAALCRILLPDSGALQEEDAGRANRRGYTRHRPALPLYTRDDAEYALMQLRPSAFGAAIGVAKGLKAVFHPGGHILGAAFVELRSSATSILFSGDLGRPHDAIMHAPDARVPTDYLVVESTYGNRKHPDGDPSVVLGQAISRAAARGGVVMIASFAVGRAQTLLWYIHRLKAAGQIPKDLPVFLNSPMATDVTSIYLAHRKEHRLSQKDASAMCHAATIVNSADDSRRLNERPGPMVILAGSGMATGGRIVHHLRAFASDPRNMIVFAGFQAGGTRGADIVAGADSIRIFGQDVPIKAEVVALDNLSAHADGDEIVAWLKSSEERPKRTFVTHGEPAAADTLRARVKRELGWETQVPEHLQAFELD